MVTREAVIGIVGDRNPAYRTHLLTEAAVGHVAEPPAFDWIATELLTDRPEARLSRYDGLLIAPGSPYRSMEGALAAIRYGRQNGIPVLGTCGGFQHIVIEFVRSVLGVADADHAETNPAASRLAVTPLICSLAGQSHPIRLVPGSRAAEIYSEAMPVEPFFCSFGLNPQYRPRLAAQGLCAGGHGEDGMVRILELSGHPFFIGTLFVPQARSAPSRPHPLLQAFAAAARRHAAMPGQG